MENKVRRVIPYVFGCFLAALIGVADAQITQQAQTGVPAPQLSGTGIPGTGGAGTGVQNLCNQYTANISYIQTDAQSGSRLWICENLAGTYTWENLKGPVATGQTAAMTAGLLGLAGCSTTTATIAGATVSTNSALAAPIGAPTSSAATAGLVNINAYVSAANTVTVSVCALGALTVAAIPYKVLLY